MVAQVFEHRVGAARAVHVEDVVEHDQSAGGKIALRQVQVRMNRVITVLTVDVNESKQRHTAGKHAFAPLVGGNGIEYVNGELLRAHTGKAFDGLPRQVCILGRVDKYQSFLLRQECAQ